MALGVVPRVEVREGVKVHRRRWGLRAETKRPVLWWAAEMIVFEAKRQRVRRCAGLRERSR